MLIETQMYPRISVSMAAAPLLELSKTLEAIHHSQVEMLHFDIEDGLFVPGITTGMRIIEELRAHSTLQFDVHLMVMKPESLIPDLVKMGADRISIHWEACPYPLRTLDMIKDCGAMAGLAFNPATPIPDLTYCLPVLDFINVLSTEPIPKNCEFIQQTAAKLKANQTKYFQSSIEWEMDGGINLKNYKLALAAGADILVIGRAVFDDGNVEKNLMDFV
jgi:ribulose-phosphate 3-epimerase